MGRRGCEPRTANARDCEGRSLVARGRRVGTRQRRSHRRRSGYVLRTRGLLSPITGALRGSYVASAWVKGKGHAVGSRFWVAAQRVRRGDGAGRTRQRSRVHSPQPALAAHLGPRLAPRRPDRTGAAAVLLLDDPGKNETFFVDGARLGGDPLANVSVTERARWHWWQYAAVWAVVLAGGAAWLARGRRRKTARLGAS